MAKGTTLLLRALVIAALSLPFASRAFADSIRHFEISEIEQLGRAMYEQDIRAARASDLLLEKKLPESEAPAGWIAIHQGETYAFKFFREKDGSIYSFADVVFAGSSDGQLALHEPTPLSGTELAQAKARLLVRDDIQKIPDQLCTPTYNCISLPDPTRGGLLIWAIAANTNAGEIQVGGHFRYTISADGTKIEARDRLFKSCLVLNKKRKDMPAEATLSALYMGWVVSDTPLEIHVYLQRFAGIPMYITTVTNHKTWLVLDGKIELVKK